MLEELHVQNLALIEDVWLEFRPGLTVLTGETGAGKTALLGALKLLVGECADSGAVRPGASEALVEGRFTGGDSEIVVKRRVGVDGRSRCALGGEMATVGALAAAVGPLVDLHGQHEHQALLSPSTHVGYLDRWAGDAVERTLAEYRVARADLADAERGLRQLEERLEAAERDADYLRFVADEIGKAAPIQGEDDVLAAKLPALQHAERLVEAAAAATDLLRGDGGAIDQIATARTALQRVEGIDPALDAISERLAEAEALVDDAGASARTYRDSVGHDPAALDETLGRLSVLAGLKKKYGPTLDEVLARRDDALAALAAYADEDGARKESRERVRKAKAVLADVAEALRRVRAAAAPGFASALQEAARELAMERAGFEVAFTELPEGSWQDDGPHRVEFLYAPDGSREARPLARIASGGEISRVMLALKSVLGAADTVETLVFDEVDAGIGGSTATAVGERLAELALVHQVVVVTHLAQVAAFADQHLVVRKRVESECATTSVEPVEGQQLVSEIARMLSGSDSSASRAHAEELLEAARQRRLAS